MLEAISPSVWLFSPISSTNGTSITGIHFRGKFWNPAISHPQCTATNSAHPSRPFASNCLLQGQEGNKFQTRFSPKAAASHSSAGTAEYTEESVTRLKFQTSVSLPGCSTLLTLLGTGYREKVLAIIGVKIYAAALYVNQSILTNFDAWKGKSAGEIQADSSLFNSIFQAPSEKSLQIVLVRDVDGKTFWDALDEAISPRINTISPTDESALSTFRAIFQRRPLKKGTIILLTWLDTSTILISVSSDGLPSEVDAKIESVNVSSALFNVFLGDVPVSPTLKSSVSSTLAAILK